MSATLPARPSSGVRVAISGCLLGHPVRFDGGNKRAALSDELAFHERSGGLFEYVPLCPEVAIGLGVPRPPIQLVVVTPQRRSADDVVAPHDIRVRGVYDPSLDPTDALRGYAAERAAAELLDVSGYIFMQGSPSCGTRQVDLHDGQGRHAGFARGLYAAEVITRLTLLPAEDADCLQDVEARDNFILRVLTLAHWQALQRQGLSAASLIAFHSRYKYLLMAHSQRAYRAAGRLLADLRADLADIAAAYIRLLMTALATPATRGGHVNALQHLQGYLSDQAKREKQALAATIDAYRQGSIPLDVPVGQLRDLFEQFPDEYVMAQVYFDCVSRLTRI